MGEDGGATTGALSDGVQGIESSEHHNPPEMLDGLDGKIHIFNFITKISFRFNIFPFAFYVITSMRIMRTLCTYEGGIRYYLKRTIKQSDASKYYVCRQTAIKDLTTRQSMIRYKINLRLSQCSACLFYLRIRKKKRSLCQSVFEEICYI